MAKNLFYLASIFILIVIAGFLLLKGEAINNTDVQGNVVQGEAQKVILSQDDLNYKDSRARAGKPILISADNSVRGCLRSVSFNIEGKRYSKYLRTSEDALQLPSLKQGTYAFSCSMGMGYGKLIIE